MALGACLTSSFMPSLKEEQNQEIKNIKKKMQAENIQEQIQNKIVGNPKTNLKILGTNPKEEITMRTMTMTMMMQTSPVLPLVVSILMMMRMVTMVTRTMMMMLTILLSATAGGINRDQSGGSHCKHHPLYCLC